MDNLFLHQNADNRIKIPIIKNAMPIWISNKQMVWKTKHKFFPTMHDSMMSYEYLKYALISNT